MTICFKRILIDGFKTSVDIYIDIPNINSILTYVKDQCFNEALFNLCENIVPYRIVRGKKVKVKFKSEKLNEIVASYSDLYIQSNYELYIHNLKLSIIYHELYLLENCKTFVEFKVLPPTEYQKKIDVVNRKSVQFRDKRLKYMDEVDKRYEDISNFSKLIEADLSNQGYDNMHNFIDYCTDQIIGYLSDMENITNELFFLLWDWQHMQDFYSFSDGRIYKKVICKVMDNGIALDKEGRERMAIEEIVKLVK